MATFGTATAECGFSLANGTARALPAEVEWNQLTSSHEGPCEVWCDDTLVFEDWNCALDYTSDPAKLPYDASKCEGASMLTSIWLALHAHPWQVYTNCAPLTGELSSSVDASAVDDASSSTAATTTTSSSASTAAEASFTNDYATSEDASASETTVSSTAASDATATTTTTTPSTDTPAATAATPTATSATSDKCSMSLRFSGTAYWTALNKITLECGFSLANGTARDLPDEVEWNQFTPSDEGPCDTQTRTGTVLWTTPVTSQAPCNGNSASITATTTVSDGSSDTAGSSASKVGGEAETTDAPVATPTTSTSDKCSVRRRRN
eukprot:jgi/Phyca11/19606/fgenesh1_pg.PHYCAscaffold_50_\